MVDFSLTNAYSPMLFSQNGYQVVVMPMVTEKANEWQKAQAKATEPSEPSGEAMPETVTSQGSVEDKPAKPKRAKQPVTAK